jgi:hypothetical protein
VRTWRVKPKGDRQRWLVFSPDNDVTEFATESQAIEFGRLRAAEAHDVLLVYSPDGQVWDTTDFRLN